MIYYIETLPKSELFRLIMSIHDCYKIDAIYAEQIKEELYKTEVSNWQNQIIKDNADIGYPFGELRESSTTETDDKEKVETNKPTNSHPLLGEPKECSDHSSDIQLNIVGQIDIESINQRMRPEKKNAKRLRLKKVATELNVGIKTIVDFLGKKGHFVETNPNTRITNQQYNLVLSAFRTERAVKENSNKKEALRTGGNRVIIAAKRLEKETDNDGDDGGNSPKPMSKNARKREERRTMIAEKRLKK